MNNNYLFRQNTRTGRYFISQILLEETIVTYLENVNACFASMRACIVYTFIYTLFFFITRLILELRLNFLLFSCDLRLKALLRLFLNYIVCIISVNQCEQKFRRCIT